MIIYSTKRMHMHIFFRVFYIIRVKEINNTRYILIDKFTDTGKDHTPHTYAIHLSEWGALLEKHTNDELDLDYAIHRHYINMSNYKAQNKKAKILWADNK